MQAAAGAASSETGTPRPRVDLSERGVMQGMTYKRTKGTPDQAFGFFKSPVLRDYLSSADAVWDFFQVTRRFTQKFHANATTIPRILAIR